MIREVIRPQQRDFHITIPADYINKVVEFIMFPLDEQEVIEKSKTPTKKSLRGVFNRYADESKIALEDKAWQMNVVAKFKNHD